MRKKTSDDDIKRLQLADLSTETQELMIQDDYIKRASAYPIWFEKNKRYADAMGVDMDTYVTVMGNAQDCLDDFLFGVYSGDLGQLYEKMRGVYTNFIIKRLQLKDEGIIE